MPCRRPLLLLLWVPLVLLSSGCLARQVTNDGVKLRQSLLDMYTDQLMDNLVRAHDNMPFVQVSYGDLTVLDNDQYGANASGSQSLTETLFDPIQRVYATMFSGMGTVNRSRTMSFVANPVTDQNDIYDAYVKFANDPSLFVVSCEDPGCAAHLVRKHHHKYYWIPAAAAPKFLELSLLTTFQRGPEAVPSGAYEVNIVGVEVLKPKQALDPKAAGDLIAADLTFSASVPNGTATMVARLTDGRTIRMGLKGRDMVILDDKKVDLPDGKLTPVLRTYFWSPKTKGYTEHDLMGAKARIYSHEFPADAPTPSVLPVEQIRASVNFLKNQPVQLRR